MKGNTSGLLMSHSSVSVVDGDFVGGRFCVRNDLIGNTLNDGER